MEPRRHLPLARPPNSPSEFIYDARLRTTTPSEPFVVKRQGVGIHSRSSARRQRLGRDAGSSYSAFPSRYPSARSVEPWNLTTHDQTGHPPVTREGNADEQFARSPATITFREPCWDDVRFGTDATSLGGLLNPRIVELDEDEPEFCLGLSSSGANERTRDDSISPKTIPKSMPVAINDDAPLRGQEPEESWFEARAYETPSTIASVSSMQPMPAANVVNSQSPAMSTFLPQSSRSQRVPEVFFQHPRSAPTVVSLSDDDATTEVMSPTGSWAPTEGEDHFDGNTGGSTANLRSVVPPLRTLHAIEMAHAASDICLAATKAHLRAHIANFRARVCTIHMDRGHGRHGFSMDHVHGYADDADDAVEMLSPSGSKPYIPLRRRGRRTRSRPTPYGAAARSKKAQDDLPPSSTRDTQAHSARSPSPLASVHPGIPSGANELDVLGLPCTDSLLANTSAICNLMWEKAARNRLVSLNAEIRAVSTMRDLLEAAETVEFDTGILDHSVRVGGSGADLTQLPEEVDGISEEAVETLLARVVSSARKICEILAYGTGVLALEDLEHKNW